MYFLDKDKCKNFSLSFLNCETIYTALIDKKNLLCKFNKFLREIYFTLYASNVRLMLLFHKTDTCYNFIL